VALFLKKDPHTGINDADKGHVVVRHGLHVPDHCVNELFLHDSRRRPFGFVIGPSQQVNAEVTVAFSIVRPYDRSDVERAQGPDSGISAVYFIKIRLDRFSKTRTGNTQFFFLLRQYADIGKVFLKFMRHVSHVLMSPLPDLFFFISCRTISCRYKISSTGNDKKIPQPSRNFLKI